MTGPTIGRDRYEKCRLQATQSSLAKTHGDTCQVRPGVRRLPKLKTKFRTHVRRGDRNTGGIIGIWRIVDRLPPAYCTVSLC